MFLKFCKFPQCLSFLPHFHILLTWIFPLHLLVNLIKGLSIFIFSKSQLFISMLLCTFLLLLLFISLFLLHWFPLRLIIISHLLFLSINSPCCSGDFKVYCYVINMRSHKIFSFLMYAFSAKNLPLKTAFFVFYRFGYDMFLF